MVRVVCPVPESAMLLECVAICVALSGLSHVSFAMGVERTFNSPSGEGAVLFSKSSFLRADHTAQSVSWNDLQRQESTHARDTNQLRESALGILPPRRSRMLSCMSLRGGASGEAKESDFQPMEVDANASETQIQEQENHATVSVKIKWKTKTIPIDVATDDSADLLKLQLFSATRVPPEKQFLLGVYKPGEDVGLAAKGIKNGQTLMLVGEPAAASEESSAPDTILDERRRGFFALAKTSKETVQARGAVVDTTDTVVVPELGAPVSSSWAERSRLLEGRDKLVGDAFNYDVVPEDAPLTLPKEFWGKQITDYTDEDRDKLKMWLNETREWRIRTKLMQEQEERETAAAEAQEEIVEHQRKVDAAVAAEEKHLNEWGLSYDKGRRMLTRGLELMATTDIAENETTWEAYKHEFEGGLDFDASARFQETFDVMEKFVEETMERTNAEALEKHARWKIYDQNLQAEIEAEEEEVEYDSHEATDVDSEEVSELSEEEPAAAAAAEAMQDAEDTAIPTKEKTVESEETQRRKELKKALAGMVAFAWKKEERLPVGLHNLGNTCYMSAAVQLLRCAPELMKDLRSYRHSAPSADPTENLVAACKLLFEEMGASRSAVQPFTMINHLRQAIPQFAQTGPNRVPMQQDSEECLSALLLSLSQKLLDRDGQSKISKLFELELEMTCNCTEAEEEVQVERERMFRLPLHIDAKTNVIHDAIRNSLNSQLQKQSPTLGRDAVYNVTGRISRLPPYLLTHFVRFYWRQDTKAKAKVCRNVFFPMSLDLIEYCTDDVRKPIELRLAERRLKYMEANPVWDNPDDDELTKKWREMEREDAKEARAQEEARLKAALAESPPDDDDDDDDGDDKAEQAKMFDEERSAEAEEAKKKGVEGRKRRKEEEAARKAEIPFAASAVDHSAIYELRAVLTHMGRYADAGHYISFVKTNLRRKQTQRGSPQIMWAKFDDEQVSLVTEEDVRKTAGGADGPIAYICLYARSEGVAEGISEAHQRSRADQY